MMETYHPRTRLVPCKDAKDCPETGDPCPYANDYGGELCMMCGVHLAKYTKSYRDKHWQKCRFGCDPRDCGTEGRDTDGVRKNVVCALATNPSSVMLPSQPYTGPDNPYLVFCKRDGEPCNAKWEE